jgi:hypothetical protein
LRSKETIAPSRSPVLPRKKSTSRKNSRSLLAILLASAAIWAAACEGGSAERQVLTAFFHAIRVRDPVLLSHVTVIPLSESPVALRDFRIADVGSDERRPDGVVARRVTVDSDSGTFVFTLEARDGSWLVVAVRQPPTLQTSP